MTSRIDWVRGHCRLLRAIDEDFARTEPFRELTIGTGIHLEPKTVALLLTLKEGGARVISTGNLNSTQPEAVEYLRANGVQVIGDRTTDEGEHDEFLREVLRTQPNLILDNGGDPFSPHLQDPYQRPLGGPQETTPGREPPARPPAPRARPPFCITDRPPYQFAQNPHTPP